MNARIRRSLISYARRLSMSWEPRNIAKNKCKVAPALHECTKCGTYCYEGDSEKNYEKYLILYADKVILFEGIKMDHIAPVVDPLGTSDDDWNIFYKRLYCDEINYRGLCKPCHDAKTVLENKVRKNQYFRPKKKSKRN